MKIAVIDMGTNTFHLLIVEVEKGNFQIVFREKTAVKIGENGINQGRITSEAWKRAIDTVIRFKEITVENEVSEIYATATSAIRNAKNGKDLIQEIREKTAIETRIISGLEEAELIYFGVKRALQIGKEKALIMDIGGGSIEFIIGNDSQIFWKQSFEIGGLRMVEMFQKHDPILSEEVTALEKYLNSHLQELDDACETYSPNILIGSSGTFDTLSDIYRLEHGFEKSLDDTEYPLTLDAFSRIYQNVLAKDREQRLAIPGMIPLRVDMIVVACVMVNYVIKTLNIQDIRVSAFALKEGVLLKTVHSLTSASSYNQ